MKRISTLLATVALAVVVASSAIAADNSPFTVTSSGISTKGFFRVVQEEIHLGKSDAPVVTEPLEQHWRLLGGVESGRGYQRHPMLLLRRRRARANSSADKGRRPGA